MSNPSPLESIFFAALAKQWSAERMAFLDEACAGDDELRAERGTHAGCAGQGGQFS